MYCSQIKEKLHEYIYRELKFEEAEVIKQHLEHCEDCKREYSELKTLLMDEAQALLALKDEIKMSIEVEENIKEKLHMEMMNGTKIDTSNKAVNTPFIRRKFRLGWYVAACLILLVISTVPAAAYYINQSNLLDKYKEIDPKIAEEFNGGKGQFIGKTSTMKNIDFTVDGIMKEKDKTTILFTVKYPKDSKNNYAMPLMGLQVINVEDQFGIKYMSHGAAWTMRSANEDGETKGLIYLEPLKPWAIKLNIRVTAMEVGKISVDPSGTPNNGDGGINYKTEKYKNIYGNWHMGFYVK